MSQSTTFTATGIPVDGNNIYASDVNTTLLALINDYNLPVGSNKIDTTVFQAIYPIGSVYINASVSTNPATLLGFGTWTSVGDGMVMVNYKAGDSDFGTLGATGGEKTHILTTAELASHTHTQNAHNHGITDPSHTHSLLNITGFSGGGGVDRLQYAQVSAGLLASVGSASTGISINNATATNQNTGSDTAHNNLQPFVTVYCWKRTS
jgi:microcystin-dependent protein